MERTSDKLFKKYCELVYNEAGINLTEEKRELLKARLSKKLRSQNISEQEYFRIIQTNPTELRSFLDAISTNHTYFFREPKSFKYLEKSRKTIWCAASSSGEEPYSIAIHCMQQGYIPEIIATDISETCLKKAVQGVYRFESVSEFPRHMLSKYFQKGHNHWDGFVMVKKEVRSAVTFKRFNLIKDSLPSRQYDIIFCRNVMIYFDNRTKEHVIERLSKALKIGGYFIIGGAESLSGLKTPLTYVEPSVYIKR